jgi:PAP2 superfamily
VTDIIGDNDCRSDHEQREWSFPGRGLWIALTAIAAVDAIWLATSTRLSLDLTSGSAIAPAVAMIVAFPLYRRSISEARLRRVYVPLAGVLFIVLAFTAMRVLDHLTMSIPFLLVGDGWEKLDTTLGFNWLAYADWVAGRPLLVAAFQTAYTGLTLVALAVFVVLLAVKRIDRAQEFVRLVFWTALAATISGAFFPAKAAMDRFASPELRTVFGPDAGVYHLPYLTALRSHMPHVLDLQDLPGMVVIPSFHTACGLLIAYCCRKIWLLQPLAIMYAAVMIASTPIMGGHYFVDLIAGGFLVVVVVYADRRLTRSAAATSPDGLPASYAGLTSKPQ